MATLETKRVALWYHGGLASAGAACCTHPLDLLKVHLQTQQKVQIGLVEPAPVIGWSIISEATSVLGERLSTSSAISHFFVLALPYTSDGMGAKVVRAEGVRGLYNGISASVGRQLTYSTTRFAIYEYLKGQRTQGGRQMPFYEKVLLAAGAGGIGGFVGTPCDMVNVRLQNDMKLPLEQRRNYKNVFDGIYQVLKGEGVTKLFNGAAMASLRAVLMTIGQIAFYDQFKTMLLRTGHFGDDLTTHFTASVSAATVATGMTQPFDVMKTRMMNAAPGTYSGILACAKDISSVGITAFYKGFIPAFTRLGPQTVLTFVFFEQLRLRMGKDVLN